MYSNEEEEFLDRVQRKLFATYTCESIVEREACIDVDDEAVPVVLVAKLGLERTEMLYARDADGNIYREYEVVDCCPTVDLGQYVEFTDECTYFITGENPDTGVLNQPSFSLFPNTSTVEAYVRMIAQSSCFGEIDQEIQTRTNVSGGFTRINLPLAQTLVSGGFYVYLRVRLWNSTTDTESIVQIPLSPSDAQLTGCAGSVNVADLTFNGSNSLAFRTAVLNVTKNYLCSLGYTEGVNFSVSIPPDLRTSPQFNFRHLPSSDWFGMRSTGETDGTDRFGVNVDGSTPFTGNQPSFTGAGGSSGFIYTKTAPCGGTYSRSFTTFPTFTGHANYWREYIWSGNYSYTNGNDTQRTCSANIYDFNPPECEGEDFHLWQFQDGGWVTVQEGETRFEALDPGDYRLQYNCDGCAYNYYFSVP